MAYHTPEREYLTGCIYSIGGLLAWTIAKHDGQKEVRGRGLPSEFIEQGQTDNFLLRLRNKYAKFCI